MRFNRLSVVLTVFLSYWITLLGKWHPPPLLIIVSYSVVQNLFLNILPATNGIIVTMDFISKSICNSEFLILLLNLVLT